MTREYKSGVEKARCQSGFTLEAASAVSGVSIPTFRGRESNPEKFEVAEFFNLYRELEPHSQQMLDDELEGLLNQGSINRFDFKAMTLGELANLWAIAGDRGREVITGKLAELRCA